jgi:hypothetical protein
MDDKITRATLFWWAAQLLQTGVPMTGLAGTAIGYVLIIGAGIIGLVALFWDSDGPIFRKWTLAVPSILLTIVVLAWAASSSPAIIRQAAGLAKKDWSKITKEEIIDKTFESTEVPLDGKFYRHCTFRNVTFVYDGQAPFGLSGNKFEGARLIRAETEESTALIMLLNEFGYFKEGIPLHYKKE